MLLGRQRSTGAFLKLETQADERVTRGVTRVRRGDLRREAEDQSFRYRKDLGLPNQVCLFRRGVPNATAVDPQPLRRVLAKTWAGTWDGGRSAFANLSDGCRPICGHPLDEQLIFCR